LIAELKPAVPIELIAVPPGVGKTHAVVRAVARHPTRALYAAPTHELASQVNEDLKALGVSTHYWRQGPGDEDQCPFPDMVEFFRGQGYLIRWGPCNHCFKRCGCTYRELFVSRANRTAQVLIVTTWHLRREDFWQLKGVKNRPLIVLDEDALSALAAPVELTVERLRSFIENLGAVRAAVGATDDLSAAWLTRRLTQPLDGDQAILALSDIFRRAAEDVLRACAVAGRGHWQHSQEVLDQLLTLHDQALLGDDDLFFMLLGYACDAVRRKTVLPNVLADLRELLTEARPVHLSVGACRWTRRASLPAYRQIVMLDATAEPTVVGGVTGRQVEVIETPLIEQRATVFQVMDKIGTRAANRRDLARDESWTRRLATEVARRHRGQRLLCITFKADEDSLQQLLDAEHRNAQVVHYGALRGLNAFEDFEAGLILGRPMPNEAQLQLIAVAAFGSGALDENLQSPPLEWQLHTHEIGPDTWQVRRQQYDDERWQAVWRHVVTGELMQAVGRLRPLTNEATIYVATNEPLPDTFDIMPVYAAELFPAMATSTRRSDFQERVRQYARTMEDLAAEGLEPTNKAVCQRLGIKPPNGMRYKKLVTDAEARAPP
jgi:hypothetical protein